MRKIVWFPVLALLVMGCRVQGEAHAPPPPNANAQVTVGAETAPPPQQQVVVQPQQQPQPQQQVIVQPVQPQATGGSNFAQISIAPGFTPDPQIAEGVSGGQSSASSRDRRCRGWISGLPDHLIQLNGTFNHLRIMANSTADVTLVVLKPDGTYACDDDSEGRNPMVTGRFTGGTHAVWIGSYQQGVQAPYRLGVSELRSVRPSRIGTPGGNVSTVQPQQPIQASNSNFGSVILRPGFVPDPTITQGVSGGQINANQIGASCRGWISRNPDHIFVAQGHFSPIRILARSSADTTLVVANDSGQVWCDDDGGDGNHPMVNANLPAGNYRVWVGSYRQGVNANYSLGFSELSNVRTSSLPAR